MFFGSFSGTMWPRLCHCPKVTLEPSVSCETEREVVGGAPVPGLVVLEIVFAGTGTKDAPIYGVGGRGTVVYWVVLLRAPRAY